MYIFVTEGLFCPSTAQPWESLWLVFWFGWLVCFSVAVFLLVLSVSAVLANISISYL